MEAKLKETRGYTLSSMADVLGIDANGVQQRMYIAGEHPITQEAIWSKKSFEKIKNVKMGRPKGSTNKSITHKNGN